MKQIIKVLFCIMLSLSCTDKIIDNSDTYIVDINNTTNISNFIDSCYYIVLDTNYKHRIGDMRKIIVSDKFIYICDEQHNIHMFNKKGKHVNTLSKRGRGHGEYLFLRDFDVFDDCLFIYDYMRRQLLVYSDNMEFINTIKLDENAFNIKILNNVEICLFADNSSDKLYNYTIADYKTGKIHSRFDKFLRSEGYYIGNYNTFNVTNNGDLFLTKMFDHHIYKLGRDSITTLCNLKFNTPDKIPDNYLDIPRIELAPDIRNKKIVRRIENVWSNDSYLYLFYVAPHKDGYMTNYITRVNYLTKEVETYCVQQMEQIGLFTYLGGLRHITQNGIVTSITNGLAVTNLTKEHNFDFKPKQELNDDDIILFFYKLK